MLHGRVDERERRDRLRLIRSESVGPVTWRRLIDRFGSAGRAIAALPDLARRGGRTAPLMIPSADDVDRELAELARLGARLLVLGDADYPPALAAIEDAPPTLAVRGNVELLARRSLAIVGSRNASISGRRLAETLAADLGRAGLVVVSGMARGIDAAAHRGALPTGTVAVVAGGIDVVYPPENASLYEAIAMAGAVVAESPPGVQPLARHFPRRNRIIAGLSAGVLVVEAALHSGSLITARLALEQGREVMAVPGSPLEPRAQGCNQLIREGAVLVQSAADVVELLSTFDGRPRSAVRETGEVFALPEDLADEPADIAGLLTVAPIGVDELIRQSGEGAAAVQLALLELELAGRLVRHAAGRVSLAQ